MTTPPPARFRLSEPSDSIVPVEGNQHEKCNFGYLVLDAQGRFAGVTPPVASMLGCTCEELLGKPLAEFLPVLSRPSFDEHFQRLRRFGRAHAWEFDAIRQDGGVVALSVDASLEQGFDPALQQAHCVAYDITQRRQAAEALQRSRTELRAIYDGAPLIMCILDAQRRVRYANRAMADFTGKPEGDLIGEAIGAALRCTTALSTPQGCGTDDACKACPLRCAASDTLQTGRAHRDLECWLQVRRGGQEHAIALNGSVTPIPNAGPPSVLLCLEDFTERKQAEERLSAIQSQLLHATRLATLGEMAAGIAHEINQPLCSIVNFAKACRNVAGQARPDLGNIGEWSEAIALAAARTGEIVRRLCNFARRSSVQQGPVAVQELADDAVTLMRFERQARRIALRVDAPQAPLTIQANAVQFHQVLVNLLRNAIESFREEDAGEREITLRVLPTADTVQVSVIDNGPGFPSANAAILFEPFFTTKAEGLGMGLAISRSIIESHNGQIWAEALVPHGTAVHFTLPLRSEKERP